MFKGVDPSSASRERMAAEPTLLRGKYQQLHRLGGGGMADVFLARSLGADGFSREVALKRIIGRYADDPHFARFFVEEARLSSRLQHPNIVSVLDFDRDEQGSS
ncbi:MAG: hypothetical protein KIT31_04500 [Deltaproteobacteria bacterium]|nr:hypothetical protein [Deltaproteobacteria bacterium]